MLQNAKPMELCIVPEIAGDSHHIGRQNGHCIVLIVSHLESQKIRNG
jgi:hypothetical protein